MFRQLFSIAVLFTLLNKSNADFSFQRIVDTTVVNSFVTGSLNDAGQVSFWSRTNGIDSIQVWNSSSLATSTVATANTANGNFLDFRPTMNNLGQVAYGLSSNLQGNQVLTTNVFTNQTQLVALSGSSVGFATVNDSGTVAYTLSSGLSYTVWVSPVGGPTTSPGNSTNGFVVLNNSGQLLSQVGNTMLLNGSALNTAFVSVLAFPNMNDLGEVVYVANDNLTAQPVSIYKDTLSASPTIEISGANLTSFSRPSINDAGVVVFTAIQNGQRALFLGNQKVLTVGDALDGSTVTDFGLGYRTLNESNQIVFTAILADGRQGMYLSSVSAVPEPSTVLMFTMLTAACTVRLARRRTLTTTE